MPALRPAVGLALALSVMAYGCESRPSLAPTPIAATPSTTPVPAPITGHWVLTTTLTEVSGQHVCPSWAPQIGRSVDWLLDVRRSGNAVTLVYDVRNIPTDHLELVGTLSGDSFTASSVYDSFQPCGGSRLNYTFESRVAGQFSEDGTRITARETWSYRVASGDAFVYYFDWNARAPVSTQAAPTTLGGY